MSGWRGNPRLPQGLVYEGVGAGESSSGGLDVSSSASSSGSSGGSGGASSVGGVGVRLELYGETGAQSSVVAALDAALGVEHECGWYAPGGRWEGGGPERPWQARCPAARGRGHRRRADLRFTTAPPLPAPPPRGQAARLPWHDAPPHATAPPRLHRAPRGGQRGRGRGGRAHAAVRRGGRRARAAGGV
jgi:hypothetical protein